MESFEERILEAARAKAAERYEVLSQRTAGSEMVVVATGLTYKEASAELNVLRREVRDRRLWDCGFRLES